MSKRLFSCLALTCVLAGCTSVPAPSGSSSSSQSSLATASGAATSAGGMFGDIPYQPTQVTIDPAIAAAFSADEIKDIGAFEKAYGFTFTAAEKKYLAQNKFVMKNLADTSIRPKEDYSQAQNGREFVSLYTAVRGNYDARYRKPENAEFYGPDVFLNLYSILYVELLKEMENKTFFPSMLDLSKTFYTSASAKLVAASSAEDKRKWTEVRNYFAVPYAILSKTDAPLSNDDYMNPDGSMRNPDEVMRQHGETDANVDTLPSVTAFVKTLKLDSASEQMVLADLAQIYAAKDKGVPQILKTEYDAYRDQTNIGFEVDFTQFTPRSHYTSSSLRRQYFRAMNWYIQLPFFIKSPALTADAFAISQLMAENQPQAANYAKLESAIRFLVGTSDDLMPSDYLQALEETKTVSNKESAIAAFLLKAHPPRIKSLAATYPTVGDVQSDEVLALTKGMRFFSGKFIIDSYWTGQLTQGDEALRPGYDQKLPPMASVVEVMTLLGSEYAKTQIPTLDFYKPSTSKAIDKAMADLTAETKSLDASYWRENVYTSALWTIQSLFDWQREHGAQMPAFMQSTPWAAKVMQTGAGFWTELRHATLLYAKQSFAEMGAGAPCDTTKMPPPAKGYIEPALTTYDRLAYLAKRTEKGLQQQGYELDNLRSLDAYATLMEKVRDYAAKELQNTELQEKVIENRSADEGQPGGECVSYAIETSDWEDIRNLANDLWGALPTPVEGPILAAKDKRTALVADVHTGGDSDNPTKILYEGIGVPKVIFVAVKDKNGPRLTVGFTYSQYEFTKEYGGKRMTDEDWQKTFYTGTSESDPYHYTSPKTWPAPNTWYQPLVAQ